MIGWQKIKQKLYKLWRDSRSYGKRLTVAGLAVLAFSFTFLFFGPLELTAFSGDSLVFTYRDILWLLVALTVGTTVTVSPLLALVKGRLFNYLVLALCSCTLCGYLQALLFNGGLGLLTGDAIAWETLSGSMVGSLLLWILIPLALMLLMYLSRRVWEKAVQGICIVLVILQLVPSVAIMGGAYDAAAPSALTDYRLTAQGFASFGREENVMVIVLDRLDYDYIEQVLKEDPTFFDDLEGFTSYTNAISAYARTRPALVHMLLGEEETTYRIPANAYYQDVWEQNDLLEDLRAEDFTVELYAKKQNLFSQPESALGKVENFTDAGTDMHYDVALKKSLEMSLFRYAPTAMKPFYWADTNYYNEGVRPSAYDYNDVYYTSLLADASADRSGKCFKLYHFFGSHAPYTVSAQGEAVEESTVKDQTMGVFRRLKAFFDQLKAEGIYDDATIIITGDHGAAMYDTKPLVKATRVGLFYKPAGAKREPLKLSSAPVTTGQIGATVRKAAGCDYEGPALDEVAEDANIVRYYYKSVCDTETFREVQLCTYEVTGDAADFANWKLIKTEDIPYNYN